MGGAHSHRQADAVPAGELIARHRRRMELDARVERWADELHGEPIFRDPPSGPATDRDELPLRWAGPR